MAVQTQIQARRGTAATWTSTNPTLAAGEMGFETDTGKFKIGTGSAAWTALGYAGGGQNTLSTYVYTATSGQTTFSGADSNGNTLSYTVGAIQVYLNGALLTPTSDFTASTGTSVVLVTGALTSDTLTVLALGSFTVSTDIAKSTLSTKGDILTATAASTPAVLAVGSDGSSIVADSAATTGLRYSATPSASNPIINSAMQVWQRGTSISSAASASVYTADRWYVTTGANQASQVQRSATSDTTNLPNIQYCLTVQRNSGQTGTGNITLSQSMESVNSIPFAGKTVTLSFYARAGSNYSPTSSLLNVYLASGTGTDQNIRSGYTGEASVISSTATLTTTWQRFTYTGTVAATATELAFQPYWTPTGTAGLNDYLQITGVQIDIGSVALPFRTYAATIQGELAACQRYYYRTGPGISGEIFAFGNAYSTTRLLGPAPVPVTMRVTPSAIEFSSLELNDFNAGYAVTALTIYSGGKNMPTIDARVASGLTANRFFNLVATGTSGYLAFSAEL